MTVVRGALGWRGRRLPIGLRTSFITGQHGDRKSVRSRHQVDRWWALDQPGAGLVGVPMAFQSDLKPTIGRTGIHRDRLMCRVGQKNRSLDSLTSQHTIVSEGYVDLDGS